MKFCEDKYELERKTQLIFISIIYSYTPLSQTYEHKKKMEMKFLKTGHISIRTVYQRLGCDHKKAYLLVSSKLFALVCQYN